MSGRIYTVADVIDALRNDPNIDLVRAQPGNRIHEPREVWIPSLGLWCRCSGRLISGGSTLVWPRWFDRWRIRRACKKWMSV